MKKYNVRITDDALLDMETIYYYISYELLAPQNAQEQYNRIAKAVLSLEELPARNRIFDSEPEHSQGIRKMVVDNYLLCYVVDPDEVTVIAVFYGPSDVISRLRERNS